MILGFVTSAKAEKKASTDAGSFEPKQGSNWLLPAAIIAVVLILGCLAAWHFSAKEEKFVFEGHPMAADKHTFIAINPADFPDMNIAEEKAKAAAMNRLTQALEGPCKPGGGDCAEVARILNELYYTAQSTHPVLRGVAMDHYCNEVQWATDRMRCCTLAELIAAGLKHTCLDPKRDN